MGGASRIAGSGSVAGATFATFAWCAAADRAEGHDQPDHRASLGRLRTVVTMVCSIVQPMTQVIPAGSRVAIVHSANAGHRPSSIVGLIASIDPAGVIALIDGGIDDDVCPTMAVGAPASLVVRGAAYPTTIRRVSERWVVIDPPIGVDVVDGRSTRRVPVPSTPATLAWPGRSAEAHVVDLSPRGARLLVEWDAADEVGRSFVVELLGRRGRIVVRRIAHEEPSLLAYLGVEFVERGPDLLVDLLRAVGAARVDAQPV
jgi:hypothetical protein